MNNHSNNRRRSVSVSAAPNSSEITTSISSSLHKSKNNFLSRFKSPNTTPPMTPSTSTSTVGALPPIGQQKVKRKPVVPSQKSATISSGSRKRYEAVLGLNTNDELYSKKKVISASYSSNTISQSSSGRGFGNLFKKKRSKSMDKKNHESISSIFYNGSTGISKQDDNNNGATKITAVNEKYELPPLHHHQQPRSPVASKSSAVAVPIINVSMGDKPVILSNNHVYKPQYHHYQVGEQPSSASNTREMKKSTSSSSNNPPSNQSTRWSNASTRKSTGSGSIYSTFGSESIYGENESSDNVNTTAATSLTDIHDEPTDISQTDKPQQDESAPIDLAFIVANNVQTRNPARVVTSGIADDDNDGDDDEEEEEEEEDDDDEEEDEDECEIGDIQTDVFVDATGVSQEDMERERIEARLSKRLSGGHFGSAGGLMISIMATESKKQQRRTSRPPPEDVVQSMMNWKRQSGHGMAKFVSLDQQHQEEMEKQLNELQSSKILEKDLPAPSPPNPEILLSLSEEPTATSDIEKELPQISIQQDKSTIEDESTPSDPKECASRLWHEDETFVQRERIAEWLGQSKTLNMNTLHEYMEYFDFATMRLDSAFRKVCSKLYFRAEAQQIDRILEAFAKRYWQCNPKTIFGSADVVYAVVYSLLLLNTDLHVAQGSYTRMTRQAFVKNTMSTVRDQQQIEQKKNPKSPSFILAWEANIEAYLKDMYISVKNHQILQPMQSQQPHNDANNEHGFMDGNSFLSVTSNASKRMSMIGGKRMNDIKRSLNTMIHKGTSARDSMLFLEDPAPRKSTSSNRQQYPISPSTSSNRPNGSRRDSFSSSNSINNNSGIMMPNATLPTPNGSLLSPNQSHMMNFMDKHSSALFANRPPYLKEGVVMRKHLLESKNQKAKHREWRECLLIVGQGELKMYGLQSESTSESTSSSARRNMLRASTASFANLADSLSKSYQSSNVNGIQGNTLNSNVSHSFGGVSQSTNNRWAAYSQLIGSIALNHSLSNALPPPGYNRTRPHVFAIQEPNGGVYLIQAGSNEQLMEWISTCNYWAARQSKEPLQGGVSNIEYGWGSCLDDVILDLDAVENNRKITGKYIHDPDTVHISNWVPPAPTMVSSILDEKTQLEGLQKYVDQLNEEINEHREIKKKILVKFQYKSQNHSKVLVNWEAKSKYMLHEIIKYQNYCDALEKSILRREKEAEKEALEEQDIEESLSLDSDMIKSPVSPSDDCNNTLQQASTS